MIDGDTVADESQIELLRYLDWANKTEQTARQSHEEVLALLSALEEQFRALLKNEAGPSPLTSAVLYMNAYGSFLSAIRTSLSGQSPPVFMILRGCLESAAYAIIAQDVEKAKIFQQRTESPEKKALCINTFTFGNAMRLVQSRKIKSMMYEMYNGFIDLGAHPNISSISNHLSIEDREDGHVAACLTFIHAPESDSILQALMACFETGVLVLAFAQCAFPDYKLAFECAEKAIEVEKRKDIWIKTNRPDVYQRARRASIAPRKAGKEKR